MQASEPALFTTGIARVSVRDPNESFNTFLTLVEIIDVTKSFNT